MTLKMSCCRGSRAGVPRNRQLALESLESRTLLSVAAEPGSLVLESAGAEPTAYEQYLLELINRGRLDPSAEAARYGIDLNEDINPGTISTDAKQPLAFSPFLISAAREHSDWMLATNTFSHTGEGGSSSGDRIAAAGYPFVPPYGWAENIAAQGTYATSQTAQDTGKIHAMLYASSGHRANQLNGSYHEVGLGLAFGKFTPTSPSPLSLIATEDFVYSGTSVFLTGVVYDDVVLANQFYTPGEGLGSVTITATRVSDNQVFTVQTWASGGYTLALPSGDYTVVASGDALCNPVTYRGVTIQTENVKLDFNPRENTPPVVATLTAAPDPVTRSDNLTLSAGGVSDTDGSVTRVEFYRGQTLLGVDEDGTDGWSLTVATADWPLGEQTLFARAQDNAQAWSGPASTSVTVAGTAVDLGEVDFHTLTALELSTSSLYYSLQTAHDGLLSVEVVAPKPPKSARARLYSQNPEENPSAVPLVSSELLDDNQRLDWKVEAGQTYFVEFYGVNPAFDVRIANLVQHNGTTVTVFGTDADDQFVFNAANSRLVSINGMAYTFADTEVALVEFDGGQGRDRAEFRDSAGDESLEAWATEATFVNSPNDSVADFTVNASNFEELQGYANSGGQDSAVLHGSAQNDKFKAEPAEDYAKVYGGAMYNRVKFFDQVDAYGGGGKDFARVFDTPGDEVFEGTMGLSRLAGEGFEIGMYDFRQVLAYGTGGGYDTATLTDSARKDEFHGRSHKSEMFDMVTDGDAYQITVRAFDVVHARATDQTAGTGGNDIAKLWGTALDDYVEAAEDWLSYGIHRPELDPLYEILAFETVKIRETPGGADQADTADNLTFALTFEGNWEML
ncbi:MAG: hypothetical protein GXX96_19405 [Planctomycetaceae bacterium]|nr:hypothetical protein [Planctomycetaceae bacterium]